MEASFLLNVDLCEGVPAPLDGGFALRRKLQRLAKSITPGKALCGTVTLDDAEDSILAQAQPMTDFAIRLTFADQLEHFGSESVRLDALAGSPAEHDAALARCRDA